MVMVTIVVILYSPKFFPLVFSLLVVVSLPFLLVRVILSFLLVRVSLPFLLVIVSLLHPSMETAFPFLKKFRRKRVTKSSHK